MYLFIKYMKSYLFELLSTNLTSKLWATREIVQQMSQKMHLMI